jgi:uncharacterized protein
MATPITPEYIKQKISQGKKYTLVFLKAGSSRSQSEDDAGKLQAAHLQYLFGLQEQGVLLINGPVLDDPNLRGVSIYNLSDKMAAIALASEDPAVKAGRLVVEAHEWFSIPGSKLT